METRICPSCNEEKILSRDYFYQGSYNKSGFSPRCIECLKLKQKLYKEKKLKENAEVFKEKSRNSNLKYYYKNVSKSKEKAKEYQKKYREANLEMCRERGRKCEKKFRTQNPEKALLRGAKKRAKQMKLPFDLEPDDIIIPDICPVLGIPLIINELKSSDNSPTLDRIIPELGYVKSNVKVISMRANMIKSYGSAEEHEAVAIYIRANASHISHTPHPTQEVSIDGKPTGRGLRRSVQRTERSPTMPYQDQTRSIAGQEPRAKTN